MAPLNPRRPTQPPAPRTSSVARSLASAAAALRAQEWHGADVASTRADRAEEATPRYTRYAYAQDGGAASYDARDSYEQEEDASYDREAFYEELRARHRSLTQRQRLAREFYSQQQQQQWGQEQQWAQQYRDVDDRQMGRRHPPVSAADAAAGRHYRASYPPPELQLVASMVPRVSTAMQLERRFSSGSAGREDVEMDRIATDNQRMHRSMQVQVQTPSMSRPASSGQRAASEGPISRTASPGPRLKTAVPGLRTTVPGPGPRTAAPGLVKEVAGAAPAHVSGVSTPGPVTRSKSPSATKAKAHRTSSGHSESADENVPTAPSVVEDPDDAEAEGEVAVVEDDASAGQKKQKKRVRYLRDTDRRNIIKRIENGEKQASLAREFGVTRAAICHIKKNRFEILSRYNMLVKSAQEMDRAENFTGPPGVEMMVHEVRANSVLLLMTMLRDNRSNGATFRRVAGRIIMILLEEALAILGTESVEVITGTGHLYRGLERKHQFCGVAIGADGFPFLVLFHQMEPDAPQGSIHVELATDRRGQPAWRLDHMDLPANIVQFKTLLFSSACSTGEAECKAIEALCSVGSDESSISLIVILAASDGIVNISNRFPRVKIISAGVDGKVDPQTDSIIPGFGDFVSRYNSS